MVCELLKLFDEGIVNLVPKRVNYSYLVKFEDKIRHICAKDEICQKDKTLAKWTDGKWYPARVLIESGKLKVLSQS